MFQIQKKYAIRKYGAVLNKLDALNEECQPWKYSPYKAHPRVSIFTKNLFSDRDPLDRLDTTATSTCSCCSSG